MVEISEIRDRESLGAWLEDQPRDVVVWTASRAAARVLPVWWLAVLTQEWASSRDLTAIPMLRSVLTTSIALSVNKEAVKAAGSYARSAAYTADIAREVSSAADSAYAVAYAADSVRDPEFAIFAVKAASFLPLTWEVARRDAAHSVLKGVSFPLALWADEEPQIGVEWRFIKEKLQSVRQVPSNVSSNTRESWSFWIEWYQSLLDGKHMLGDADRTLEMLTDIVTTQEIDWYAHPDKVNQKVNLIWARHKERAERPSIVDQAENEIGASMSRGDADAATLLKIRQALEDNKRNLPPTLDALQEFVLLELERWMNSNYLNARVPEECRRQVKNHMIMHRTLLEIGNQVPIEREASEEEAQNVLGLARLYVEKLKAVPRDKVDHIVEGGLVASSAGLLSMIGMPPLASVAIGAMTFARPNAKEIIEAAKTFLEKGKQE